MKYTCSNRMGCVCGSQGVEDFREHRVKRKKEARDQDGGVKRFQDKVDVSCCCFIRIIPSCFGYCH